jgi:hypothetical protein
MRAVVEGDEYKWEIWRFGLRGKPDILTGACAGLPMATKGKEYSQK